MSVRQKALEALYEVLLNVTGTPCRDENGKVVGYEFTNATCKQIRDAVSAVTEAANA